MRQTLCLDRKSWERLRAQWHQNPGATVMVLGCAALSAASGAALLNLTTGFTAALLARNLLLPGLIVAVLLWFWSTDSVPCAAAPVPRPAVWHAVMATLAAVSATIVVIASGQIGGTYAAVLIVSLALAFLSLGMVLTGKLAHAVGIYLFVWPLAGVLGVTSPPITPHWSLGSTVLLASLLVIGTGSCVLHRYSVAASRTALLAACLLAVSFLPSVLSSSDPARSFWTLVVIVIWPIAFFCISALALRSAVDIKVVAMCLAMGSGIACLMGFYFVRHFDPVTQGFRRAIGFPSLHVNPTAQILAGVIPVAVVLILEDRRILGKALWAFNLVLLVGLLLCLRSRTGYIGLGVGLAALGLATTTRRRSWMVIAAVGLVGLGAISYLIWPSHWRMVTGVFISNPVLAYSEARWHLWQAAVRMIIAQPVFGVGMDMFGEAYGQYGRPLPPYQHFSGHPHNVYLQIGAESGLIALAGFMSFFVFVARRAFGHLVSRANSAASNWLFVGLATGWLAYSVTMLLDGEPFGFMANPTPGIVYMTLSACVVATGWVSNQYSSVDERNRT